MLESLRSRFSWGATEFGEPGGSGRFRSDPEAVGRALTVALMVSSRHSQREPRVHLPQPTASVANTSSTHAQAPLEEHEPQLMGGASISTSSGGLMICEIEKG